jgi:hypothetical protein
MGFVAVLLALAIVGFLAKDALKQYGLVPGGASGERRSAAPADRVRNPGLGEAPFDASSAPGGAATPIDRARQVEGLVKRQAEERARRDEGATR